MSDQPNVVSNCDWHSLPLEECKTSKNGVHTLELGNLEDWQAAIDRKMASAMTTVFSLNGHPPRESVSVVIGQRLRVARENRQLTTQRVAQRMKLPIDVIERLESGDWDTSAHGRGWMSGCATTIGRWLGVPTEELTERLGTPLKRRPTVVNHWRWIGLVISLRTLLAALFSYLGLPRNS